MQNISKSLVKPHGSKEKIMYILNQAHGEYPKGTVVFLCSHHDYGCAGDDSRSTGIEHESVTLSSNGEYPFFTVPHHKLTHVISDGHEE